MGEIVNLRRARKAKSRATADTQAAANRLAFGRTKAEQDATKTARERTAKLLDGAKRDRD